jgi:SAM-dependent methyltransferase
VTDERKNVREDGVDGYDEATYGDRIADTYDDWYGRDDDLDACVARLADLAEQAASGRTPVVVELGVGTGRLAVPLATRGLDVRGVDASAAMVERLHTKVGPDTIPVALGDMAATDPPRRAGEADPPPADLVFVASNTFFGLPTDDAQAACLRRVRSWLATGGRFVVAAFVPDIGPETTAVTIRSLEVDRVVLSAARVDESDQTMTGQFIDITERGVKLRPWHLHYQTPAQLDALAAAAGLVLESRWASWNREPFDDTSPDHVSVYGISVGRRP